MTKKVVEGFRKIPGQYLTRIVYEVTPFKKRAYYDRKVMREDIKPLSPEMSVVGPAYTVNDERMCANVIEEISEGSVLVVNASKSRGTYIGVLMTRMLQQNKVAGVVIDGYVTHTAAVLKSGMPIFCKGSTIRYSGYSLKADRVQVPLKCGDVVVNPGDIILGNADGVLVLGIDEAEKMIKGAQVIMKICKVFMEDYMDKGVRYFDIPGVRNFWRQKSSGEGEEWKIYEKWLKEHGY